MAVNETLSTVNLDRAHSRWTLLFRKQEAVLLLITVILAGVLGLCNPNFLSFDNLLDLIINHVFLGILALGVLVVLISGGIDISFTAVVSMAQYIMALFIINHGGNMIIAFLISILCGILLGAVNALLIHWIKASAIIITIATSNIFYGCLILLSGGKWLYNFPAWFASNKSSNSYILPIVTLLAVIALTWLLLSHCKMGREVYALGGNIEAAKRVGINIFRIRLFVYSYMGLMAGFAALVQAYIVQNISPSANVGRELDVLAAVVLGGANLAGGKGTVWGTVLGVFIIAIVSNGLILLKISSYWHTFLIGLIIITSVGITAYRNKINEQRGNAIHVE
jgi:simple sugar transport system permease protein